MTTKPMFREAKPAAEPTPHERAQANIRACVMLPDLTTFITWQRSGEVIRWQRDGGSQVIGSAYHMTTFNGYLERAGTAALAPAGTPKRPERTPP